MRNRIGPLQGRVVVFGQTEQKETGNEPGNERKARHGGFVVGDANGTVADGNHMAALLARMMALAALRAFRRLEKTRTLPRLFRAYRPAM